jgi:RNA 3'-terminal phosphate cyclase (ATP)
MIDIDGSQGEGGGQILRSALGLSMATGLPFRMSRIRAGREKPGLMRQHLTAVTSAAEICGARVTGAHVGSMDVEFSPGAVKAGEYRFVIGTAGSTLLVLQAVMPPLLRASGPTRLTIEGGTHAKAAPPFEFLDRCLGPALAKAGARINAEIESHGFFPAGGGRVVIEITPCVAPVPLELTRRGPTEVTAAKVLISKVPQNVAERECDRLCVGLELAPARALVRSVLSPGPGNAVCVEVGGAEHAEIFSAIGERGRSAEHVAEDVIAEVREYLASDAPVGPHLADQLMTPLAVLAGGTYRVSRATMHARTNIAVLRAFGVEAMIEGGGVENEAGVVRIAPLR